ncbi:dTDP-4-dehydrorhamnose reductase [Vibrio splendidus]|uniref:dTDP-4-dehydrorhamnose reductase n=1 Tax=Vibrio splendidus TaxID=29497 RepID=UPI000C842708|nr:dTDP-4-dehydrorhamnose reductase [Vibrio splendidus]PMO38693.1 dTDP-4-dehydrorhamnose reductase [Vibrio splendidus]
MRVLITGCNGQVGSCLTRQLANIENIAMLALDRELLDITNQAAVNSAIYEFQPTIIINAAAYTAVDQAEKDIELSYLINRDGPKYLAQAAQNVGAVLLHISTDYVFEGNKIGEYSERDIPNPQGVYGASKLAGEIAVSESCDKHIIIRTAWVFCEFGNNFVKTMLNLSKSENFISIVSDQIGGPTYAGDLANEIVKITEHIRKSNDIPFGIYHYSGLPYVSWYDFADAIFDSAVQQQVILTKPQLKKITTEQYPTPAKRPDNSRLNTEKIKNVFSSEASDWQAALKNIKFYVGKN